MRILLILSMFCFLVSCGTSTSLSTSSGASSTNNQGGITSNDQPTVGGADNTPTNDTVDNSGSSFDSATFDTAQFQ